MNLPDLINGLYELFGSAAVLLSCLRLLKDKQSKGISPLTVFFFTSWGFWNLYYYPSLGQWWSGLAAGGVCLMNSWWLGLILYYGKFPGGRKVVAVKAPKAKRAKRR